jgi:predicted Zn finger-like uncharacterized protein
MPVCQQRFPMIVKCPSCAARFRLDREKLAGKRVTLRCTRCRSPFKIELPYSAVAETPKDICIMIAHSDVDLCNTIKKLVDEAGFKGILGHSGADVLAAMDVYRPLVAVIDVALQGLYAFEVVDTVRKRPGLEKVKIILLSSVYNKAAYKRSPISLYGADDYIEKHHIPDDLILKINRLLVDASLAGETVNDKETEASGVKLSAMDKKSESIDYIHTVNKKIQSAEVHEVSADHIPEQIRAERLARIIVSDISLYYQDRIDEGILRGDWSDLLAAEIKEARNLFMEHFPNPEIQKSKILEAAFLDLLDKRRRELGG